MLFAILLIFIVVKVIGGDGHAREAHRAILSRLRHNRTRVHSSIVQGTWYRAHGTGYMIQGRYCTVFMVQGRYMIQGAVHDRGYLHDTGYGTVQVTGTELNSTVSVI